MGGKKTKAHTNKDNYSKEELADILKFGALNIFKNGVNQAKCTYGRVPGAALLLLTPMLYTVESMNLDDVLDKAEDFDTEQVPGQTSLGGEEFLRVAIQDVKADLTSWDDIIPVADRELAMMEKARADAAAQQDRKSKLKSLGLVSDMAAAESDGGDTAETSTQRRTGGQKTGKTVVQRSMELNEKDIRLLIRGVQKFGDIRYRYDKIAEDSKLTKKNRSIVQQTADELVKLCREAMIEFEEETKARLAAGEDAKKHHKAVMVSYKGATGINAETTIARFENLKLLNDCKRQSRTSVHAKLSLFLYYQVLSVKNNPATWSIPSSNIKGTQNWNVDWAVRDDSALLVGIWRHGFGSWDLIQADDDLGLKGKFFLEADKREKESGTPAIDAKDEKKEKARAKKLNSPGPVHLVRRGDYLLQVLRESDPAAKMSKEASGPRTKKPKAPSAPSTSVAPARKPSPPKELPKPATEPVKPISNPTPNANGKRAATEESDSDSDSSESESEVDTVSCKEMLRPVKRELKELGASKDLPREEKVKVLSRCLTAVGLRIKEAANEKGGSESDRERTRKHLWKLVCSFWPIEGVAWTQLVAMCKSS